MNSGSNGSDGAFHPTTNTVINMADHPEGIYHYTSVIIPEGVTVTFIRNANNTPVVWLVQSIVVIEGVVGLSGQPGGVPEGGLGGPGGWRGGNGRNESLPSAGGSGPGGGVPSTSGQTDGRHGYGNVFLVPLHLHGGSGGGGTGNCGYSPYIGGGGGGGGGVLLIAAAESIHINGVVRACGGDGGCGAGRGSGGAIRLVSSRISGSGVVETAVIPQAASVGRIRFDALEIQFVGAFRGIFTRGFQPTISPISAQLSQLSVASDGGVPGSASQTGQLSTPNALLPAQQGNPVPIMVQCANVPLNTQITFTVRPANGPSVSATGLNNTGTLASSTATVLINMPRGGGIIYATADMGN